MLRDDPPRSPGPITDDDLNASIAVYNGTARDPPTLRVPRHQAVAGADLRGLPLLRAGMVLPVRDHTKLVREIHRRRVDKLPRRRARQRARRRQLASFCEQPPLGLIKSIEMAGCYIVDDDFMLVTRWLLDDVPTDGDPLENSSKAFLHRSAVDRGQVRRERRRRRQFLLHR